VQRALQIRAGGDGSGKNSASKKELIIFLAASIFLYKFVAPKKKCKIKTLFYIL